MNGQYSYFRKLDEDIFHYLRMEKLIGFFRSNWPFIVYMVSLAVIAYGYELFSFSMKIDSENHAVSFGGKLQWVMQGRWGMYLLNVYLLPDPIMPFIPVLIGLLGLLAGVMFYLLALSDRRDVRDWLAAPLAIACPVLAYAFYFTTLGYGLGVAFAVSAAGIYALTRWRWRSACFAVMLFAFSIGIYQAVILLIPVLFGFYLVVTIISRPNIPVGMLLRWIAVFLMVVILSYGFFEIIRTLALKVYGVPYAAEYLNGYINVKNNWLDFSAVLSRTLFVAIDYYTGSKDFYLYPLNVLRTIFIITMLATIINLLLSDQGFLVKIIGLLALAAALCVPFSLHLFNDGYMPPRIMLGIPFVFAGLIFSACSGGVKTLRVVLGFLVLCCFFKFSVVNNRYALSNQMNWKADQDLSLMILQRIHTVWHKLPLHEPPYPVELVGAWQHIETPLYLNNDVIGASFFSWDGDSTSRMVKLWFSMRQFNFKAAELEEKLAVVEQSATMPVWPAAGSVDVVNGVIVVKIGEYPDYIITALCQSATANEFCLKRQRQ